MCATSPEPIFPDRHRWIRSGASALQSTASRISAGGYPDRAADRPLPANMLAAYLDHGLTDTAVFELFVRKLPVRRGFLMAPALEQALPRNPAGAG